MENNATAQQNNLSALLQSGVSNFSQQYAKWLSTDAPCLGPDTAVQADAALNSFNIPNCPICGEYDRVEHTRDHLLREGEKPFFCKFCYEFFTPTSPEPVYTLTDPDTGQTVTGATFAECHAKLSARAANAALDSFNADAAFRAEFEKRFPTVSFDFIKLMDDIGNLGVKKYGDDALVNRAKRGDLNRQGHKRLTRRAIAEHAGVHFSEYIDGIKHDVFGTGEHQLAAAAFNPMMEFLLSQESK